MADSTTRNERLRAFLGCGDDPQDLRRMLVAHASQLMYGATSEVIAVVLPYINKSLGGGVEDFATLLGLSSLLQLVGGIAFGPLSDRYGPKLALLAAHGSTLVSAVLIALAGSWSMLLVAELPSLLMQGFQAGALVAVVGSTQETRAVAMGRVGMSYGIGFLLGTVIVSGLASFVSVPAVVGLTVMLELAAVLLVHFAYPAGSSTASKQDDLTNCVTAITRVLKIGGVSSLLVFKGGVCIGGGLIFCMLQQFAMDPFDFTTSQTSLLMAYLGLVQLVAQGVAVPCFGMPSTRKLQWGTAVALAVPLLGLGLTGSTGFWYVLWVGPFKAAYHCANMLSNGALTCIVPDSDAGTILALSMALMTLAFLMSPYIAAFIFERAGFRMVSIVAMCWVLAVTWAVSTFGVSGTAARQMTVDPGKEQPEGDEENTALLNGESSH